MATLAQANRKARRFVSSALDSVGERRHHLSLGVFWFFDRCAHENAPGFAARLIAVFGSVRYLDVGAGTGRFAECLRELGCQRRRADTLRGEEDCR